MSYVLQCRGSYVGQAYPKIKLVDSREEISINCIFDDQVTAKGASQILRLCEGFEEELFKPVGFTSVPSKYENITFASKDEYDITIIRKSDNICIGCGVQIPASPYIEIASRNRNRIFFLCPFCCVKIYDTGKDLIKDIPDSIKNEYYAYIIERGLDKISDKEEDEDDNLPF